MRIMKYVLNMNPHEENSYYAIQGHNTPCKTWPMCYQWSDCSDAGGLELLRTGKERWKEWGAHAYFMQWEFQKPHCYGFTDESDCDEYHAWSNTILAKNNEKYANEIREVKDHLIEILEGTYPGYKIGAVIAYPMGELSIAFFKEDDSDFYFEVCFEKPAYLDLTLVGPATRKGVRPTYRFKLHYSARAKEEDEPKDYFDSDNPEGPFFIEKGCADAGLCDSYHFTIQEDYGDMVRILEQQVRDDKAEANYGNQYFSVTEYSDI